MRNTLVSYDLCQLNSDRGSVPRETVCVFDKHSSMTREHKRHVVSRETVDRVLLRRCVRSNAHESCTLFHVKQSHSHI